MIAHDGMACEEVANFMCAIELRFSLFMFDHIIVRSNISYLSLLWQNLLLETRHSVRSFVQTFSFRREMRAENVPCSPMGKALLK